MSNKRVDKFHGNIPAWLKLADLQIDYFTQFIKAWIPFNAWFSSKYTSENNDRDILNRIKKETNPFRDKIITHFRLNDKISSDFLNLIGRLHFELEQNSIPSIERRISFSNIVLEKNSKLKHDITTKGNKYKVITEYKPNAARGSQKINIKVILLNGYVPQMDWDQNEWDIEELRLFPRFVSIGSEKERSEIQSAIVTCYNEINPLKPTNLVLPPKRKSTRNLELVAPANSITIDASNNLYFVDNPELIAKGLIEILYCLRNVLFHGEIEPSESVQKIYKEAYYILYTLIPALN